MRPILGQVAQGLSAQRTVKRSAEADKGLIAGMGSQGVMRERQRLLSFKLLDRGGMKC